MMFTHDQRHLQWHATSCSFTALGEVPLRVLMHPLKSQQSVHQSTDFFSFATAHGSTFGGIPPSSAYWRQQSSDRKLSKTCDFPLCFRQSLKHLSKLSSPILHAHSLKHSSIVFASGRLTCVLTHWFQSSFVQRPRGSRTSMGFWWT